MYQAPYIDSKGLHIPSFNDIQDNLVAQAQSIFGTDIYLDNDSQDMQYIGAIASAIYDTMQLCQMAVANQSPDTATGASLDSLVKVNGLQRLPSTYSTVPMTITGIDGTPIAAGKVQDQAGYIWDFPPNSVIPDGGVLSVTATCETPGDIVAEVGAITQIVNSQYGWTSAYNAAAATPGVPTETDTQLRVRQNYSVEAPSQTPLSGTQAAIQAIDGVKRVYIDENNGSSTDAYGVPAHTIACVVDGGDNTEIAQAIAIHKTIGCGTYGSTAITLDSSYAVGGAINFTPAIYNSIGVNISIMQLSGYTHAIQDQIISNIEEFINSVQIGMPLQASSLYVPALTAMLDQAAPSFYITSLTINSNGGSFGSTAYVAWNEAPIAGTITLTGGL